MPRRTDGPPSRAPQSEPFETTGAFALPNDSAGGLPPANDPGAAFPPRRGEEATPFETTGAFARPPEWSSPPGPSDPPNGFFGGPGIDDDEPGFFGRPESFDGRAPFNGPPDQYNGPPDQYNGPPGPYNGPADQTAVFNARHGQPGPGQPGPGPGQPGPGAQGPGEQGFFGGPPSGPFDRPGPFGGPDGRPFDGSGDRPGPFDADRPFGSFEEGPADRTARFDSPSGPVFGSPPEPGDIKVAGEPTAVQAPAWADAETGFLGSGWSNDEQEEPVKRRGGRRKSGRGGGGGGGGDVLAAPTGAGKGRVALLSVAAVAVVLGGTVAGVKFMSSPGGKCEGATCAAVQATSSQPGPAVSEPAEEESPEEEPSETEEESTPSKTPTPTASYSARTPRRTASPTPTPTKTKVKKSAPAEDPAEDPPVEDTVSESPSETVSSLGSDSEVAEPDGATPAPTEEQGPFGSSSSGSGVNVQQTIQQRLTTYKAELTVSNSSAQTLRNPTVSVPVDGKVVNVNGAEWTQDGDLLILDVSTSLAAGASINVSFTATGRGSKAQNCGMVAGECAVT
ncbi:hypothetical protein [Nonomuraea insulae]|uniref:CBM2 domain-containing protein n=1 Tax=Nonomuraea insulae TaxID=1616787 RepID=A0ABW1D0K0_9ACTN